MVYLCVLNYQMKSIMTRKMGIVVLSLGWIFLLLFIVSGYFFNRLTDNESSSNFQPIQWSDHMELFTGAIQCSLLDEDLLKRQEDLKVRIFSKVTNRIEKKNGIVYYFDFEKVMLADVLEFVQKEKECCPFFKFDISILPFKQGLAIQIGGSEVALELLRDFENND